MKREFIQRTDEEWKDLFEKVNVALGIELYSWQKDVIMLRSACIPSGRRNGRTTAFILRELLNLKGPLERSFKTHDGISYKSGFLCDRYYSRFYAHSWYPNIVIEIDDKLQAAGIETCFTQKNDISKEELLKAIITIKQHCRNMDDCKNCPLRSDRYFECMIDELPYEWCVEAIANKLKKGE